MGTLRVEVERNETIRVSELVKEKKGKPVLNFASLIDFLLS